MRPDIDMRGSFITTFTGLKFYPLDPHDQDRYRIEDIAHALANCCRFAGHTREFYSVAQHSVLMANMTEDIVLQRWALMHDSCEAYVGDMVRPLKKFYVPWKRIERRILEQIAIKWGMPWPMPEILKTWDSQLLYTEARDLLPIGSVVHPAVPCQAMPLQIKPLPPAIAKEMFLATFEQLFKRGTDADQQREAVTVPVQLEGDHGADPQAGKGALRVPGRVRPEPHKGKVRKKKR